MKTYKIEITETLQRTIEIEAENEDDALQGVKEFYDDCDIVLDANNFVDVEFSVVE